MKFFIFLMLIAGPVLGQNAGDFQGKFKMLNPELFSFLFDFQGDSVHLSMTHCTGQIHGSGVFQIQNKTLALNYADYPKPQNIITSKFGNNRDSVYFSIQLFDEMIKSPLTVDEVITVLPINKKIQLDENGKCNFSVLKSRLRGRPVIISSYMYLDEKIQIDSQSGNYHEMTLFLQYLRDEFYPAGEKMKLKILNSRPAGFSLQIEKNVVEFKKIDEKEYAEILGF